MTDPLDASALAEIRERVEKATLEWAPGYEVHSDGSVWSVGTNWRGFGSRRLVPIPNSHGYLRVRLVLAGGRKSAFVHKLVAEAFLAPRPSPRHEIRHLDGNRLNNDAGNLRWGTRRENAADRVAHGTGAFGERNGAAKLTAKDVQSIRTLARNGFLQREIAARFSVSQPLIGQILRGEIWQHAQ